MIINHNIIDNLCKDAGESRTQKALRYKEQERVKIKKYEYENPMNFEISAEVEGSDIYDTYILVKNGEIENITCDCPDYYNYYGVCKHTLATVLKFLEYSENERKNKELTKVKKKKEYINFAQIVNTIYNEELNDIDSGVEAEQTKNKGTIKIEPKIIYDKFSKEMKVEFKIGNKRMYKLKNLAEFYTLFFTKQTYRYGDKLEFRHTKEMFKEESRKLLEFVLKYAEIIKYTNSNLNSNYRYYGKTINENYIVLGNSGIDELFEILKNKRVTMDKDYNTKEVEFVESDPPVEFSLIRISDEEYKIVANFDIFKITIINGKDYQYVLTDDKLYRCSKNLKIQI